MPWQPILGKVCEMTFIQHTGILQRIRISQFRFIGVKEHNLFYIMCNFGEYRSTNPRDYAGSFCTFSNGKNQHIIPNISGSTGPNFTDFSALLGLCMQIIKLK